MLIQPNCEPPFFAQSLVFLENKNPQQRSKEFKRWLPDKDEIKSVLSWLANETPEQSRRWLFTLFSQCNLFIHKTHLSIPGSSRIDLVFESHCDVLDELISADWHSSLEKLFPDRIQYYLDEDIEKAKQYAAETTVEVSREDDFATRLEKMFIPSAEDEAIKDWLSNYAQVQFAPFARSFFKEDEESFSSHLVYIDLITTAPTDESREADKGYIDLGIYPLGVKLTKEGEVKLSTVKTIENIDSYKHFDFLAWMDS